MEGKIQGKQTPIKQHLEEWLRANFPNIADWEISRLLPDLQRFYRTFTQWEGEIAADPVDAKEKVNEYRRLYKANGLNSSLIPTPIAHERSEHKGAITLDGEHQIIRWLSPEEHARASAMMHFWARLADFDPDVQQFRHEVLGGKTLATIEDAAAFLSSDALAVFSRQDLEESGVPLVGHTTQVSENTRAIDDDMVTWRVAMTLTPPGVTIERTYTETMGNPKAIIQYPDFAEEMFRPKPVRVGSVLHDLLCVSESLTRRYEWRESDAPLFVVSGLIPRRDPLQLAMPTTTHTGSGIQRFVTLKVEPWVSVKTVRDAYQRLQREAYWQRIPKPISIRNSLMFEFATRYMGKGGSLPPKSMRREIFEEWNDSQSDANLKYATSDEFNRALRDTHRRFLRLHTDFGPLHRRGPLTGKPQTKPLVPNPNVQPVPPELFAALTGQQLSG